MRSSVGSPGTEKGTVETWAASRAFWRGKARSGEAPVTSRARRPRVAAAAGTWRRVPSPKRMRAAVANSKGGMKSVSRKARYSFGKALPSGHWRLAYGAPQFTPFTGYNGGFRRADRSVDRRKRLSHVARQGLAPLWGKRFRLPTHFFKGSEGAVFTIDSAVKPLPRLRYQGLTRTHTALD